MSARRICAEGRSAADIFERCRACGRCAEECPAQALKLVGALMSAGEVCAEAEKESAFFGEEGGVTFSGGEPLLQPDFLKEALYLLKQKDIIPRWKRPARLLGQFPESDRFVDLFLYDYKLFDSKQHKKYTGQDNGMIRENLRRLKQAGAEIRIGYRSSGM